jgi:hypothetical protein
MVFYFIFEFVYLFVLIIFFSTLILYSTVNAFVFPTKDLTKSVNVTHNNRPQIYILYMCMYNFFEHVS